MKKVLFATTALAALAIGGVASARGSRCSATPGWVSATTSTTTATVRTRWKTTSTATAIGDATDDLRAVSRVRFGVNMTGETDSGITFGATIRADNASGGQGDPAQRPDRRAMSSSRAPGAP